ncbi:hypothetical protein ACOME3_005122 [Neoechinorhynchus agilis]
MTIWMLITSNDKRTLKRFVDFLVIFDCTIKYTSVIITFADRIKICISDTYGISPYQESNDSVQYNRREEVPGAVFRTYFEHLTKRLRGKFACESQRIVNCDASDSWNSSENNTLSYFFSLN